MKEPLITFVIRTHRRPGLLERNADSLAIQTDKDWEGVVLVDKVGRGIYYANGMLAKHKERVYGKYVYILDDDNRLIIPDFVQGIRAIVEQSAPDIIMVKANLAFLGTFPLLWEHTPRIGKVDTLNFIVERELWKKHISVFHKPSFGDFCFIKELFRQPGIEVFWWDRVVAEAMQIGRLGDRK